MDAFILRVTGSANDMLALCVIAPDEVDDSLVTDLSQIGWKWDGRAPLPGYTDLDGTEHPPEIYWIKRGTGGQFGEWSKEERKRFLGELRRVMSHHKIPVPVVRRDPD